MLYVVGRAVECTDRTPIPPFITQLTMITNDEVGSAEMFPAVADAFIQFMQRRANKYSVEDGIEIDHIMLVAHNGKAFDIPFFIQQLTCHKMVGRFLDDERFGLSIDTLQLAWKAAKNNPSSSVPTAYNLSQLFQLVSGYPPSISHHAREYVKAIVYIF